MPASAAVLLLVCQSAKQSSPSPLRPTVSLFSGPQVSIPWAPRDVANNSGFHPLLAFSFSLSQWFSIQRENVTFLLHMVLLF